MLFIESHQYHCYLYCVVFPVFFYFQPTLNSLMATGRETWTETRSYLQQLLSTGRLTDVNGYLTLMKLYWSQIIADFHA